MKSPSSPQIPRPCPNCQTLVEKNYCPQCGQPAHLHDGSFFSMVMHFFAHYLHYESKLWQTLKMLLFRPGSLTVDFKEKKRARHVEPLSMYIFIAVMYFLLSNMISTVHHKFQLGDYSPARMEEVAKMKEERLQHMSDSSTKLRRILAPEKYDKLKAVLEGDNEELNRKMDPLGPKIFFLMVPVYAALIGLFFVFKKGYNFVEHSVFSIHVHSFWFVTQLILELLSVFPIDYLDGFIGFALLVFYSSAAMVTFYRARWLYALTVSIASIAIYLIVFYAVVLAAVLYII